MRDLLRQRDFRLLYAGQTLSMFGDMAMLIVLAMWAKELTGSNGVAGSVFAALVVPSLLAPLGGVLIDRFRRRTVMIVADLATAAVVLLLLLVDGRQDLWLLYVVAFLYGASLVAFSSARSALLSTMLPEEQLGQANGALGTVREALRLVGAARRCRAVRRVRRPRGCRPGRRQLSGLGRRAARDAGSRAEAPPVRAALPRRGQRRCPAPARQPGAARDGGRDGHLHAGDRHQRVGVLRRRRPRGSASRSSSSACWAPSRASARSSRRDHHRADPADRRAEAGQLVIRPDLRGCPAQHVRRRCRSWRPARCCSAQGCPF